MSLSNVLVVGAGPTGLAAALFLRRRGLPVWIIDQAAAPSSTSRALVVNPRTLELLEPSGVAQRTVTAGRALEGALFYQAWRPLARMEFGRVHPRYGMLVLSQVRSEQFLAEALAASGVFTERCTEVETLEQDADTVHLTLALAGAASEGTEADFVFGADGAHSRVREALGLGFEGRDFPEPWTLKGRRARHAARSVERTHQLRARGIRIPARDRGQHLAGTRQHARPARLSARRKHRG
jgi:2-polyprenyl-6-methoxyphenol hydroxylase-like FAD-dependent oxidoreductase